MSKSNIAKIQIALLAIGALAWWAQAKELHQDDKFSKEPNVLNLKRSPFGRTLSLAMRGPLDVYWHRGEPHDHDGECGPDCTDHDHDHHHDHGHVHGADCEEDCEHDHLAEVSDHEEHICDDEDCEHDHAADCEDDHDQGEADSRQLAAEPASSPDSDGVRPFLLNKIKSMRTAYNSRTNQRSESPRHKAYIMGEMQKKLEVSYELDPSNLSAYGAYHLFLNEALARVENSAGEDRLIAGRRKAAHILSHKTLTYCWDHRNEAPAMITGATAAHDCLQVLHDQPNVDPALARYYLEMFDLTLHRYETLRAEMIQTGTWEQFPPNRRSEMDKAHYLVKALNRADHATWGELTGHRHPAPDQPDS